MNNSAFQMDAFLLLDTFVYTLCTLFCLHVILTVYPIVFSKAKGQETCHPFYIALQLQEIQKEERWQFEHMYRITTSHTYIDIKDDELIKRSPQSGYEYIGTCSGVSFQERGGRVYIAFPNNDANSSNDETEYYPVTYEAK